MRVMYALKMRRREGKEYVQIKVTVTHILSVRALVIMRFLMYVWKEVVLLL